MYRGLKIHCTAGFPETSTMEKTISYQFDSERQTKLTFHIAVEAYQPVFDETVAVEASKRIEHVAFDVEALGGAKRDLNIDFKNFEGGVIYPSGTNIILEWIARNTISDVCTLKLSYLDENDKECFIAYVDTNNTPYIWHIPDGITTFVQPTIVFNDQEIIREEPEIKIIPGPRGVIDASSFVVIDGGLFNTKVGDEVYMPVTIEYELPDGTIKMSDSYSVHISNRTIDKDTPILIDGDKLRYEGDINMKEIRFKLSYPLDETKNTISDNVLII